MPERMHKERAMTLRKSAAAIAVIVFTVWPVVAQATQQAASVVPSLGAAKLGFINLERALAEVQEGKSLFGELQTFIDKKNLELKNRQDELNKKQEQLRTQERTLSEETKLEMQKDLEERRTGLTRFQEDTSKEIDRRQNANVQRIGQKMQPLIQAYAKEKALTAIVIWSPQLYAYVDENVNVTDEIIKRYDSQYPFAAPGAPAKSKIP
jgi:outer membrane protein